jgi:hypothetical protein
LNSVADYFRKVDHDVHIIGATLTDINAVVTDNAVGFTFVMPALAHGTYKLRVRHLVKGYAES